MSDNNEALDFNLKLGDILRKSNNRAWIIVFISLLSTALMAGLYLYKPIIKTVPYVVKIDSEGVPSLLTAIQSKKITVEETLDKYFAKEYVIKREGYFFTLIEQDYLYVQLLSSASVAEEYRKIYTGEESRDKKLGDTTTVSVNVLSIVLGESAGVKNAIVRIKQTTKKKIGYPEVLGKFITLSYEYDPNMTMSEKDRLVNPLGFRVLAYRIDEEVQ